MRLKKRKENNPGGAAGSLLPHRDPVASPRGLAGLCPRPLPLPASCTAKGEGVVEGVRPCLQSEGLKSVRSIFPCILLLRPGRTATPMYGRS